MQFEVTPNEIELILVYNFIQVINITVKKFTKLTKQIICSLWSFEDVVVVSGGYGYDSIMLDFVEWYGVPLKR